MGEKEVDLVAGNIQQAGLNDHRRVHHCSIEFFSIAGQNIMPINGRPMIDYLVERDSARESISRDCCNDQ